MNRVKCFLIYLLIISSVCTACGKKEPADNRTVPESAENAESRGLEFTDMIYGNESACYAQEALTVENDDSIYYIMPDSELIRKDSDGKVTPLGLKAKGGLNYYDGRLFYISDEDGYAYYLIENDTPTRVTDIKEKILSLIVCEKGYIYTDENNHLHVMFAGDDEVICRDRVLWVSDYGEWIIYTRLSDSGIGGICAYCMSGKEERDLCDYGLYPTVYDDVMYYQNREGGISSFDLATGDSEELTDTWGQEFLKTGDQLFFTNTEKIYRIDLKTREEEILCDVTEDGDKNKIEKMWQQDEYLVYIEKDEKGASAWKTIDENRKVSDYEKIFVS